MQKNVKHTVKRLPHLSAPRLFASSVDGRYPLYSSLAPSSQSRAYYERERRRMGMSIGLAKIHHQGHTYIVCGVRMQRYILIPPHIVKAGENESKITNQLRIQILDTKFDTNLDIFTHPILMACSPRYIPQSYSA
jgi:hypothetical protein